MNAAQPLAERMRPRHLDEVCGQDHLLEPGAPLRSWIDGGQIPSLLFWGPPGVGKTTIARLLARHIDAQFLSLSAVMSGVKEIRQAVADAQQAASGLTPQPSILFIDEIHRFNKSQQDALLPYVEDGTLTLIGATTEIPSFEVNAALLSRMRVMVLRSLEKAALVELLGKALTDAERGLAQTHDFLPEGWMQQIAAAADGDARRALIYLETAVAYRSAGNESTRLDDQTLARLLGDGVRRFDKQGDQFYEQISALHKSVRGSDPDAALYWLARMLDGGCDPHYLARRIARMAVEDIGLADPRALELCLSAWQAYERLGSPEGELALGQAAVYLACAPKSNAVYAALGQARAEVKRSGSLPVPVHLRNAPTQLMKDLDFGKDYRYDPDQQGGISAGQHYFPDELRAGSFYQPTSNGIEARIAERLSRIRAARGLK